MYAELLKGAEKRQGLIHLGNKISTASIKDKYPHLFISSDPGLGKSHTVNEAMKKNKVNYYHVTGNTNIFNFGVQLATINYLDPKNVSIISVDDCDEILKNGANINVMKNVLDGARNYHHQKLMTSWINQLPEIQQKAIEKHMDLKNGGFKVPTDKMIFVFTANIHLPEEDEPNKNEKIVHLKAIADRVRPYAIKLEPKEKWGWIADVALNTPAIPKAVPKKVVEEACVFMFDTWEKHTKKSIRGMQMMCDDYINYKKDYKTVWRSQYLR
jgi:hypothetical protein